MAQTSGVDNKPGVARCLFWDDDAGGILRHPLYG